MRCLDWHITSNTVSLSVSVAYANCFSVLVINRKEKKLVHAVNSSDEPLFINTCYLSAWADLAILH